jgi:ribosome-binding protein aMBF1 (putative translation factor)
MVDRQGAKTHLDERARGVVTNLPVEEEKPPSIEPRTRIAGGRPRGLLIPRPKLPIKTEEASVPEQIQKRFGDRVREVRLGKGISQEGLAFKCDLDRAYVGGVERGERNISLVNIYKIARGLGIPAKELMP